ncbi:MAG: sulfotransferase domain-containing protein [Acidiphilium sp.]|nr:sulfotransferase domain-containing protein [Acidiphilium sp.]MDD4934505.1 sulfotransferase domain-containing protein [Acidiphilium sp.]
MGKLVWLASYPKSGNTWLRAFIHNYFTDAAVPYDINRLTDLTTGESGAALYQRHDPRPASTYSVADVMRLRSLVHRDIMGNDTARVFVKTHNAALAVHGIPLVTPEVTERAIYLVRDPRDVAISYSAYLGISIDAMIGLMASDLAVSGGDDNKVLEFIGSWSGHVQSWTATPNPKLLVLRYEDLLTNPSDGFGDVVRFLGTRPDPARLDRAIRFSEFTALRAQEQNTGFIERPARAGSAFFRSGAAQQWRNRLNPASRCRIERDHADQMRRFLYRY